MHDLWLIIGWSWSWFLHVSSLPCGHIWILGPQTAPNFLLTLHFHSESVAGQSVAITRAAIPMCVALDKHMASCCTWVAAQRCIRFIAQRRTSWDDHDLLQLKPAECTAVWLWCQGTHTHRVYSIYTYIYIVQYECNWMYGYIMVHKSYYKIYKSNSFRPPLLPLEVRKLLIVGHVVCWHPSSPSTSPCIRYWKNTHPNRRSYVRHICQQLAPSRAQPERSQPIARRPRSRQAHGAAVERWHAASPQIREGLGAYQHLVMDLMGGHVMCGQTKIHQWQHKY